MLKAKTKMCQTLIEKKMKGCMNNYCCKRKKSLNYVINCVEELENVYIIR